MKTIKFINTKDTTVNKETEDVWTAFDHTYLGKVCDLDLVDFNKETYIITSI